MTQAKNSNPRLWQKNQRLKRPPQLPVQHLVRDVLPTVVDFYVSCADDGITPHFSEALESAEQTKSPIRKIWGKSMGYLVRVNGATLTYFRSSNRKILLSKGAE
jgi:hypothetical protein